MPSPNDPVMPNIGEALAPLLHQVPIEQQPLLIAFAERLAATRYREWAHTVEAGLRDRLLVCADREEDIAARIEGLYPKAAEEQRALLAAHPEIHDINRRLFAGRPLAQQFAIQAHGERLGAATWRSFARHDRDARRQAIFLACAELEEQSAVVLEHVGH
jgi:hypothetical protein